MKKSSFLTFCFAFIPGFGQMYQGYMKRGLSIIAWFAGIIVLSVLTRIDVLLVLLLVVWAYSFFDTFNLRNLSDDQRAVFEDSFIPNPEWAKDNGLEKLMQNANWTRIIAWGLIGIGVLFIFGNFWDLFYSLVWSYFPALAIWVDRIPGLIIAALIIFLGLRMLNFGKKATPENDDIHEYKGGDDNA